ncbi:MAG: tetraacyldisaccharide 4'-kinase [Gammaproteobacteria bacterium]
MGFWREFWRRRGVLNIALLPLSVLFGAAAAARRALYARGVLPSFRAGAPVAVVGNLTAGGGGKTPLVIALVLELQRRGFSPGVAARGFGGKFSGALMALHDTPWTQCGDEPLLIRRRTGAPVCVCKNRAAAAQQLTAAGCDIIICDDGMQHYALSRDMEICAVNAQFGLGNGWLLPAGPLREGGGRLAQCAYVAVCGAGDFVYPGAQPVAIITEGFYSLDGAARMAAEDFAGKKIAAIAGIAAPQRFFDSLRAAGIVPLEEYALRDHEKMDDKRLGEIAADIILLTEKDAVKYSAADSRLHYMRVEARLPAVLADAVCRLAGAPPSG